MTDAINAEALVDDGSARPPVLYVHASHRVAGMHGAMATFFRTEAGQYAGPDGVTDYVRRDVVDAALEHLAAKLEASEARIAGLREGLVAVQAQVAKTDGRISVWRAAQVALEADGAAVEASK